MYSCIKCNRDVTAEVDTVISSIVNNAGSGQIFGVGDYFETRYVCNACNGLGSSVTQIKGSE